MAAKVEPDSRSALRRATHVLLIEVRGARRGVSESDGLVSNTPATLKLQVVEILKGSLDPEPQANNIPVETTLVERVAPRVFAVHGLWSERDLAEGARYVVLSRSSNQAPRTVLAEPQAFELWPASEALADARRSLGADQDDLDLGETVQSIEADHPVGPLLADYLLHRTEQEACFGDETAFMAVLAFLKRPSLPNVPRTILTEGLADTLRSAEARDTFRIAYIQTAAWMLTSPEAEVVHASLIEEEIPAVAGTSEGAVVTRLEPDTVFGEAPGLRERLRAALGIFPDPAAAELLLEWLRD